jgi:hypothetical protein
VPRERFHLRPSCQQEGGQRASAAPQRGLTSGVAGCVRASISARRSAYSVAKFFSRMFFRVILHSANHQGREQQGIAPQDPLNSSAVNQS